MISRGAGREDGVTVANVIPKAVTPQQRIRSLWSEPRAAALTLLGLYFLGTAGVLASSPGNARLVVIHILGCAIVAATLNPRRTAPRVVGDFLPLIAAPLLYGEIPALIAALGSHYRDSAIQAMELALFGAQPSQRFAALFPNVALSEVLHAGYLTYYPAIFVPPLLLYARGEREGFSQTVAALTVTYLACWVVFAVAPVEGPRYLWGPAVAAPDGPMRSLSTAILATGSSRGAAFPSSHMAVMTAQTILAFRWQRGTSYLLAVLSLLVGLGAVYGGFHYATDMVAGALLGAAIAIFVLFWFSKQRFVHELSQ